MKFKKPKIKFFIMTKEDCLENMKLFLDYSNLNNCDFTTNNIIDYFKIDKNELFREGDNYLKTIIENSHNQEKLLQTNCELELAWNNVENLVLKILGEIFNVDYEGFDEYKAITGINPVCPRFLKHKSFCLFDCNSSKENIYVIIHELIHFYWFEFWNTYVYELDDNQKEFPSLEWVLSELSIDSIITQTKLNQLVENKKPAYDYFYDIKTDDGYLINYLRQLYINNSLKDFMIKGITYIKERVKNADLIK